MTEVCSVINRNMIKGRTKDKHILTFASRSLCHCGAVVVGACSESRFLPSGLQIHSADV